jgi:hypothetical protein
MLTTDPTAFEQTSTCEHGICNFRHLSCWASEPRPLSSNVLSLSIMHEQLHGGELHVQGGYDGLSITRSLCLLRYSITVRKLSRSDEHWQTFESSMTPSSNFVSLHALCTGILDPLPIQSLTEIASESGCQRSRSYHVHIILTSSVSASRDKRWCLVLGQLVILLSIPISESLSVAYYSKIPLYVTIMHSGTL